MGYGVGLKVLFAWLCTHPIFLAVLFYSTLFSNCSLGIFFAAHSQIKDRTLYDKGIDWPYC